MNAEAPIETIEPGKRLIRIDGDKGLSLAERVTAQLQKLAWRTPFHSLRLRGRYPLKLLAVPTEPIAGSVRAGSQILSGELAWQGETIELEQVNFAALPGSPAFQDHLQSFDWLRDLAAAAPRERAAPIAELMARKWLAAHGASVTEAGWRPDLWGHRILAWGTHAPLILSSGDVVYRSAVLNALARGARHLDRGADKAPHGFARVVAWAGVVAAGLLIPGGDVRVAGGEAGLARALAQASYSDGGLASRSPVAQLRLVELLVRLLAVYDARRREPGEAIAAMLPRIVPALLCVTLGDGALSSWQGGAPVAAARVSAAIQASGVRARPLRQARDWGYQRVTCGQTTLVFDAAPPPHARIGGGGSASTLAFELSDGASRLIVNCGGGRGAGLLPGDLGEALRTTAAHSALTLGDTNSTALHSDGTLGRGVGEVELDRQEIDAGSRIEASHDGYVRKFGLVHRRQLLLSADGRELRGEDILLPGGRRVRRPAAVAFAARFHLGPGVEASVTADGLGALIRMEGGPAWQFRCRGGALTLEDSLWIDAAGRPRAIQQLVVSGEAPAGGANLGWVLRRAS